jgi:hypothetical protein
MINSKDITPEYMQSIYKSEKLENLNVSIPNVRRFVDGKISVNIDMENLWKYVANLYTLPINLSKIDKEKVTPENISAVCIYGSILYKHFPTEFTKNAKSWFGLGKEYVKTIKMKKMMRRERRRHIKKIAVIELSCIKRRKKNMV